MERVDGRKLRYIIERYEKLNLLSTSNPTLPRTMNGQLTILKKYLKRIKGGKVKVEYKQTSNIGRHFAKQAMSLQSMNKTVRHTICNEFYTD